MKREKIRIEIDATIWRKLPGMALYLLASVILPVPLRLIYGFRVKGKHNLRNLRGSGFITVSNHCQYIEPAFTGLALWPRRILYTVEEKNLYRRDIGWLNRLLGALGLPKENPMVIAPIIRDALKEKNIVHFYPEGKLYYRNQKLGPFYRGAFLFALRFEVPILPLTEVLHTRTIQKVFPFLPPKVSFIVEKPIYPEMITTATSTKGVSGKNRQVGSKAAFFAAYVRKIMQGTIDRFGNISGRKTA